MKTLQLRADTREHMLLELLNAGLADQDDEGNPVIDSPNVADLGTLSKPTGKMVEDPETGEQVPEYETCSGYHANVTTEYQSVVDTLKSITIHPKDILVKWAE